MSPLARAVALAAALIGMLVGVPAALPAATAAAAAGAIAPTTRVDLRPAGQDLHFESVQGIPRGVVAALAQDRQGFIWVATGDGLMRYDGYRLRPQLREHAEPGARNLGWIRALHGGRDGRLWIGSETAGLLVYDPATERVDSVGPPQAPGQPATHITALAEDSTGAIWVGWRDGRLDRVDTRSGHAVAQPTLTLTLTLTLTPTLRLAPGERVQALVADAQGGLWLGSDRGLAWRPPGAEAFMPVLQTAGRALGPPGVQALAVAADGRIWAGTGSGELLLVDPVRADAAPGAVPAVRRLTRAPGLPAGTLAAVTQIEQDRNGRIWVGRASGIDLHDPQSGLWLQTLRHDRSRSDGLAGNEISSLLRDRNGVIWVGSLGGGLQRHMAAAPGLSVRGPLGAPGDVWSDPDLRSLLVLADGQVWAGTHASGVVVLDPALHRASAWTGGTNTPRLAQAMAQGPDGDVWVAADGRLQRFSPERVLRWQIDSGLGKVWRLVTGPDGTLWLATEDGVHWLPPGAARPQRVARADGQPANGDVFALALAADSGLWVGGVAGLHRIPALRPGQTPQLQAVVTAPAAGLGNTPVIGLLLDTAGTLWVDTAVSGLHRMRQPVAGPTDGEAGAAGEVVGAGDRGTLQVAFDRISERLGASGRPFGVNLMQDQRGRIWSHMHVYDPASDTLHELTAGDGVRFGTGWFGSYARHADGRMLFGGSRGLLVVDAEAYEMPTAVPSLAVAEWRVDGARRPLPAAGASGAAGTVGTLRLAPRERSFSVEFAALDVAEPPRISYAWRLDGIDRDWVKSGAELRTAAYALLEPGEYTLRARASNAAGIWGRDELVLSLQVEPVWWERKGLHVLGVLLAAGLSLLAMRRHTAVLRRRQLALEAEVQRRTAALHDASVTDPLTGLRNRRYLAQHIESDVAITLRQHESRPEGLRTVSAAPTGRADGTPATAPEPGTDLIFFLADIDHFKRVNDRHGHDGGDAVLVQMRERLQAVFRDSDHIVRWGGEEFLVVARGSTRAHAAELAERLRAAVAGRDFVLPDGAPVACSCSIGFCSFPLAPAHPRALDWSATLRLADAALYEVKRSGRDGWLGLVDAQAVSAEALHAQTAGSLQAWAAGGGLQLVRSGDPRG